jgi:hypothetical protein
MTAAVYFGELELISAIALAIVSLTASTLKPSIIIIRSGTGSGLAIRSR